MATKSTMLHVAVEPKIKANLTREAKQRKVSVGWLIREAVESYLKSLQKEAA